MKKSHTTIIFISSIVSMILTVCLFIFIFRVIKNKNEHISAVEATILKKTKEKEDEIIFAQKISEIKEIQDSISGHFVDQNKIDSFVGYLEDLGLNFGSKVSVTDVATLPQSKNKISFKLSIKGTFSAVMKTIGYLENIPYQVNITQVYLNKNVEQVAEANPDIAVKSSVATVSAWQADVAFDVLSMN